MIRPEAERWGICRIIPPPEDEGKNIAGFREEVFKYRRCFPSLVALTHCRYFSSVDPTLFKFKTKVLQCRRPACLRCSYKQFINFSGVAVLTSAFLLILSEYYCTVQLSRIASSHSPRLSNTTFYTPYIGNVAVDLYRLYFEVYDRHGFSKITEQQWAEVATALHVPLEGSGIVELKKIYSSLLLPYEPHFKEKQKEKKKVLRLLT